MRSPSPRKRKDIGLVILSAVDVITGVLSLVITALAVQVVAVMASGLTLFKAVKVAVQSEKTAIFVKPMAVYAVRKLTRSEKMKGFFGKIKENLKNNPITLVTAIVEFLACGVFGYASVNFVDGFSWAGDWKSYAVSFGVAFVVYAIVLPLTIYLGHDNAAFAAIRKYVKAVGGDKAVEVLDKANEEIIAEIKTEAEKKAAEQAAEIARAEEEAKRVEAEKQRAIKEQEIYEYALKREEEKKARAEEERKRQLINAYRGEFANVERNTPENKNEQN